MTFELIFCIFPVGFMDNKENPEEKSTVGFVLEVDE